MRRVALLLVLLTLAVRADFQPGGPLQPGLRCFALQVERGGQWRTMGHVQTRCTVERNGNLALEAASDAAGIRSVSRIEVDGRTLLPLRFALLWEVARTGGDTYERAVQGNAAAHRLEGQVDTVAWVTPWPNGAGSLVLPDDLAPLYYEWILARLQQSTDGALYLPRQGISTVATQTEDGLQIGPQEVHLTAHGMELPAEHLRVVRIPDFPPLVLEPMPPPSSYVKPGVPPDDHRDVSITAPTDDGATLSGTLTLPIKSSGPWPAVLIIGNGDRNGHVGGTSVYRDLADDLAHHGIASLRYDKRGVGNSVAGNGPDVLDTYLEDARTMWHTLQERPEVQPAHLHLLGHGEGGLLAIMLGEKEKAASVIAMAAPALPENQVLVDQLGYQLHELHRSDAAIADTTQRLSDELDALRDDPAPGDSFLGAPGTFWRSMFAVDPRQEVARLRHPLLILQGELDVQVLPRWADSLLQAARKGGVPEVKSERFEGLNHVFTRPGFEGVGEDYEIPLLIDPAPVASIVHWVKRH
ncbi:MAG: alpha/beta hydrolase family protein [Candidatus Xenobia bacterium]